MLKQADGIIHTTIMGAAEEFINGYISGGQDTVYLQKFNVNGTMARYSCQYGKYTSTI